MPFIDRVSYIARKQNKTKEKTTWAVKFTPHINLGKGATLVPATVELLHHKGKERAQQRRLCLLNIMIQAIFEQKQTFALPDIYTRTHTHTNTHTHKHTITHTHLHSTHLTHLASTTTPQCFVHTKLHNYRVYACISYASHTLTHTHTHTHTPGASPRKHPSKPAPARWISDLVSFSGNLCHAPSPSSMREHWRWSSLSPQ